MRIACLGAGLVMASCAVGCGADGATGGHDAVQSVDGRSAVDTVMALVAVRLSSPDPELDGAYVDRHRMTSIQLTVDGQPWGLYAFDEDTAEGSSHLVGEPSHALLIASLTDDLEASDEELDTVAEWVTLLDKHLAPGGHVVTIERVEFEMQPGETAMVEPRLRIPLDIEQGDATAYLGEVVIDVEVSGGAR